MKDLRRIGVAILAAGRGSRLAPLTDQCPKPLVPFMGAPILEHIADYLDASNIETVGINAYHLAHHIRQWLDGRGDGGRKSTPWRLIEEDYLSGSGGGVRAIADVLTACETLIYYNGDILTNVPLQAMLDHHRKAAALATLLTVPADAADGNIRVDLATQRVSMLPSHTGEEHAPRASAARSSPRTFGGIAILERRCIERLPTISAPCIIRDSIGPALGEGHTIAAFDYGGLWHDLGTPSRLFDALQARGVRPLRGAFPTETSPLLTTPVVLRDGRRTQRFVPA